MTLLELKGVGISLSGQRPIGGLDLTLADGAALAIVGRARSGKTPLARLIAGALPSAARIDGDIKRPKRVAILAADARLADLQHHLKGGVDLLIGDEPGRALDPAGQLELLAAMQVAHRERNIGLIIFTRDFRLPLVMRLDAAILSGGKIVERGPAADLLEHPHHAATRDLTGGNKTRTRTMARPPIGEPLLELRGVTKRFDGPLARWWQQSATPAALENLSFTVRRGEAVGLLGGAGAGKSLLLSLVAGLGRTSAGHIEFERHSYRGANLPREARKRIAYLFPDPHAAFNPDLAVGLTLTEPMRVEEQLLIEEQADRLVEVVRVVGLEPDILGRLPRDFTPFELQRLALARALVGRPSFIILDEPTARLDPLDQAEFLVLFNRVRADYGLTVFCASREFEVLRTLADRILVLERGRIVEGGKPSELREAAQHAATRALLASRYPEPPPPMPPEPVVEPEPPVASPVEPVVAVAAAPAFVAETVSVPTLETIVRQFEVTEPEPEPEPVAEAVVALAPEPIVEAAPSALVESIAVPELALEPLPEPEPAPPPEPEPEQQLGVSPLSVQILDASVVELTPATEPVLSAALESPADPRAQVQEAAPADAGETQPVIPAPENTERPELEAEPQSPVAEPQPAVELALASEHQPEPPTELAVEPEPAPVDVVEPAPELDVAIEPMPSPEPIPPDVLPPKPAPAEEPTAEHEPAPAEVTPSELVSPEPTPTHEPPVELSSDGADESPEAGEVQHPVAGDSDGAGSVEPLDDEPVR